MKSRALAALLLLATVTAFAQRENARISGRYRTCSNVVAAVSAVFPSSSLG